MNIFDVFKALEKDDTQNFDNGYNKILQGYDSYELIIIDKEGHEIILLMSNWKLLEK